MFNQQDSACPGRSFPLRALFELFLFGLAIILLTCPAIAATYYVDNTNCPGPGDGSIGNPYCKIQDAITLRGGPGTTILVRLGDGDYKESLIILHTKSGTATNPFIIRAATLPPNIWGSIGIGSGSWTDLGGGLWRSDPPDAVTIEQVIMDDGIRYRRCTTVGCNETNMSPGTSFHKSASELFVKCLTGMPCTYGDDSADLCVRIPITIRASYVILDGFSILNSSDSGILIAGSGADTVLGTQILNCSVAGSRKRGIEVGKATGVALRNNQCSNNTEDGILLASQNVRSCTVVGNQAYGNIDYGSSTYPRGTTQGIQIGDTGTSPADGVHTVERNSVWGNQDSGFDVLGSHYNVFRNNQSWQNGDHGFDHKTAQYTVHVGDLAYANGRSGISIESDAPNTTVKNCIIADNARESGHKDFELEVLEASFATYVGDRNIIYRPSRLPSSDCGPAEHGEEADSILICLKNTSQSLPPCVERCDDPPNALPGDQRCFGTVLRYASNPQVNPAGNESHSKQADPNFMNPVGQNFFLQEGSPAIDAADTTVAGWTPTDYSGLPRHDDPRVANSGVPLAGFGDIGPNEFDDGQPSITVDFGYETLAVSWMARGEDGVNGKPIKHQVFVNGILKAQDLNPPDPGTPVCVEVGPFTPCSPTPLSVEVVTTDANDFPYGYTARSNIVTGTTSCMIGGGLCETYFGGGGAGGGGFRSKGVAGDYELALAPAEPNPSPGVSIVKWSVPKALEGTEFELAVFDVAGRKVATLAEGVARAGWFTRPAGLRSDGGELLGAGVYFLRLRIGSHNLKRPLVVAR